LNILPHPHALFCAHNRLAMQVAAAAEMKCIFWRRWTGAEMRRLAGILVRLRPVRTAAALFR
jgi:hypothetical protein